MDNQFDSTMNYRFSTLCREFFGKREYNEEQFSNEIVTMLMRYQKNTTYAQMNLLDSHDVPRFLYDCEGDTRKLLLAALFQMTFVGAPSVFYGDEVFISGKAEMEYRRPMIWQPNDKEYKGIAFYKKIIALRKNSKAFTEGSYKTILVDNEKKIIVFERNYKDECYWMVLHNAPEEVEIIITLDDAFEEVLGTSNEVKIQIQDKFYRKTLTAYEGVVLKKCKKR